MTLEYDLTDDGTMDTVVIVRCTECGASWDERITDTSDYRDEDGELNLVALMEDTDIECLQCECGVEDE